jgi:hypothetical protein
MHLSAEPIELLEAHNQWRPLIRIDPIGVTLHEQIGMDVNALDPHFDQTEEAAQFFTVFADAVSCRNDSTPRQPSQKADDMGARLCVPSSLTVLIRTTGYLTV